MRWKKLGEYLDNGGNSLPILTITRLPSGSTKSFWEEDIPRLRMMDGGMTIYLGHLV